jgi:hypothetical protein
MNKPPVLTIKSNAKSGVVQYATFMLSVELPKIFVYDETRDYIGARASPLGPQPYATGSLSARQGGHATLTFLENGQSLQAVSNVLYQSKHNLYMHMASPSTRKEYLVKVSDVPMRVDINPMTTAGRTVIPASAFMPMMPPRRGGACSTNIKSNKQPRETNGKSKPKIRPTKTTTKTKLEQ